MAYIYIIYIYILILTYYLTFFPAYTLTFFLALYLASSPTFFLMAFSDMGTADLNRERHSSVRSGASGPAVGSGKAH